MIKDYPIALEVTGELGMFADPYSGSEAISYPFPPPSACIGMIESIVYKPEVEVSIVAIAVCNSPYWQNYAYNSTTSPLRISDNEKLAGTMQVRESVLLAPSFQILAILRNKYDVRPVNHAHAMQDMFYRRMKKGQSFHPVSLGRKEFMASYFGIRKTPVEQGFSTVVPSMVFGVLKDNRICRDARQNVVMRNGILHVDEDIDVCLIEGRLAFAKEGLQSQIEKLEA